MFKVKCVSPYYTLHNFTLNNIYEAAITFHGSLNLYGIKGDVGGVFYFTEKEFNIFFIVEDDKDAIYVPNHELDGACDKLQQISHNCSCDFYSVVLRLGCQCNGK